LSREEYFDFQLSKQRAEFESFEILLISLQPSLFHGS